jgi:hypothetical protein
MPGVRVDGGDVLAVYEATREAVERGRRAEADVHRGSQLSRRAACDRDDPRACIDLERVEREGRVRGRYEGYLGGWRARRRDGGGDQEEALERCGRDLCGGGRAGCRIELVFDNAYVLPPPGLREGWDG